MVIFSFSVTDDNVNVCRFSIIVVVAVFCLCILKSFEVSCLLSFLWERTEPKKPSLFPLYMLFLFIHL